MNHTTQRFPRTSQRDHWRGVIEHHRRPLADRVADVLLVIAMFGALGVLLCVGLSS